MRGGSSFLAICVAVLFVGCVVPQSPYVYFIRERSGLLHGPFDARRKEGRLESPEVCMLQFKHGYIDLPASGELKVNARLKKIRVSLDVKDMPLPDFCRELDRQMGKAFGAPAVVFRPRGNEHDLKLDGMPMRVEIPSITLRVENEPVYYVLETLDTLIPGSLCLTVGNGVVVVELVDERLRGIERHTL